MCQEHSLAITLRLCGALLGFIDICRDLLYEYEPGFPPHPPISPSFFLEHCCVHSDESDLTFCEADHFSDPLGGAVLQARRGTDRTQHIQSQRVTLWKRDKLFLVLKVSHRSVVRLLGSRFERESHSSHTCS